MKKVLLLILSIAFFSTAASAEALKNEYSKVMNTPECRQAPISSGMIEYDGGPVVLNDGQLEVIHEVDKVVLKWGENYQSFDFSSGEVTHNSKIQPNEQTTKNCYDDKNKVPCANLGKLYWNTFLNRPRAYLADHPNVDHMNSVVCAQSLIKAFSEFFQTVQ